MYNRYVRNDTGTYERVSIPEQSAPHTKDAEASHDHAPQHHFHVASAEQGQTSPLAGLFGKSGLLSGILDKLKLSDIDTGDLLLLVILFLLFRDGEDDELLIALGLLLIL